MGRNIVIERVCRSITISWLDNSNESRARPGSLLLAFRVTVSLAQRRFIRINSPINARPFFNFITNVSLPMIPPPSPPFISLRPHPDSFGFPLLSPPPSLQLFRSILSSFEFFHSPTDRDYPFDSIHLWPFIPLRSFSFSWSSVGDLLPFFFQALFFLILEIRYTFLRYTPFLCALFRLFQHLPNF